MCLCHLFWVLLLIAGFIRLKSICRTHGGCATNLRRRIESQYCTCRLRAILLITSRLILTYLVPCHLVTTHTLPSKKLLAPFPRVEKLFRPLCDCIKKGDLRGFDAAMTAGEEEFVKRRIYLPLERGRDIALRNLFRKVFIAGGFDEPKEGQPPIRRTRVPVAEFAAALRIGTHADDRSRVDIDEVECLLSNLIYKVRIEMPVRHRNIELTRVVGTDERIHCP